MSAALWTSLVCAAPQQNRPKPAVRETARTGCIDQQDDRYVLIEATTGDPIVNLEAEGFPKEGFAKYLGHKVTVRGNATPGDNGPVFRVRSIENLSDACGQQQH